MECECLYMSMILISLILPEIDHILLQDYLLRKPKLTMGDCYLSRLLNICATVLVNWSVLFPVIVHFINAGECSCWRGFS